VGAACATAAHPAGARGAGAGDHAASSSHDDGGPATRDDGGPAARHGDDGGDDDGGDVRAPEHVVKCALGADDGVDAVPGADVDDLAVEGCVSRRRWSGPTPVKRGRLISTTYTRTGALLQGLR